jgi:hypothetical protein
LDLTLALPYQGRKVHLGILIVINNYDDLLVNVVDKAVQIDSFEII